MKKLIIFILALSTSLFADEFKLQFDNDFFYDTDGFYTHGTLFSLTGEPEEGSHNWLLNKPADYVRKSFGQYMYTPSDISVKELQEDDRPYGGLLFGEYGVFSENESKNRLQSVSILIGGVGEFTQADHTQDFVHDARSIGKGQGWEHQLENEPVVNLNYTDRYRLWRAKFLDNVAHYGVSVGNLNTHASAGTIMKVGHNIPNSYELTRLEPTPRQTEWLSLDSYSLWGFAGVEGRAVAHNIFLDGNTFEDSHSVDKEDFVGDFFAGASVRVKNVELTYSFTFKSDEFKGQTRDSKYGGLSLSYRW